MINDRFTKGVIGGMSASILHYIYAYFAKLLGFTNADYLDVARSVLLNSTDQGFYAILVSFLGQLVIDSFWGVIFVFLTIKISEEYFVFKGIVFGLGIWFLVRVIITKFFKLPVLSDNTPEIAFFFFIGAALFGLTLALVLKLLNTFSRRNRGSIC
ncbi:hypothetical protein JCM17380_03490 [Desulfosporosinus burensis]